MDEELEMMKAAMEDNRRFVTLVAAYLNNEPRLADPALLEKLEKECRVDRVSAFCALLSAAFGLDPECDPRDSVLEKHYLRRSVKMLDPAEYINDPYYKNISIEHKKVGKWELLTECFVPGEGFIYNDLTLCRDLTEIPNIGFFNTQFNFPAVLEGGREWMMITPNEINTMKEHIAAARGKVVTFGLGMGYFAYMASRKEEVVSVTVVEKEPEVISLFKECILPQFENRDKINIVCADAFSYAREVLPCAGFDFAFADIWHDVSDGVSCYMRFKKLEKLSPRTKFAYWIERSILSELRKSVFFSLCDKPGMTAAKLSPMLTEHYLRKLAAE